MAARPTVEQALKLLQEGRSADAVRLGAEIAGREPGNPRAHLVYGMALRMQGALAQARSALERAAALDPAGYAPAFELGVVLELSGDAAGALAAHRKAIAARPDFAPARFAAGRLLAGQGRGDEALAAIEPALRSRPGDAFALHEKGWILHRGRNAALAVPLLDAAVRARPDVLEWRLDLAKALADLGHDAQAREQYAAAVRLHPGRVEAHVAYGRFNVSRAQFGAAAELFAAAIALDPRDAALPIYLAQAELVQGHWSAGWRAYARREPRLRFEAQRAAIGLDYRPERATIDGAELTLVGEQGLGDVLFYLRFAPALKARGARLRFVGEARLLPLLRRCGLFDAMETGDASSALRAPSPILVGDLPAVPGVDAIPASLAIAPDPARHASWEAKFESAGPRPWIGITWRAGTAHDVLAHGLSKAVPLDRLCAAVAPLGGTVFALQRGPAPGEIDAAARALGARLHDFSAANADLEDALAVVALLDRHVAVSSTNMHLAALAGKTADVLVPFPPEWRWGADGRSPWFPGFRVHRQEPRGDWSRALDAIAKGA